MSTRLAILALALAVVSTPPNPARGAPAEAGSTRDLYLLLIRQARSDGRPRAALAYLDDFDRQHPDDLEALVLRINCLLDLGQTAGARAVLARIAPSARQGAVSAARGHVLAAENAWAEAAEQYAEALRASPADPLIGNALGYAQLRAGRPAQAVETLKSARDLAPSSPVIRNNLLLALTMAGRGSEADTAIAAIAEPGARATLRRQIAEQSARIWGAAGARP